MTVTNNFYLKTYRLKLTLFYLLFRMGVQLGVLREEHVLRMSENKVLIKRGAKREAD
jgi:hypothetical protein